MLTFFTDPYPNELIYSAIARYHFYSGNINKYDTLKELFGSRSVVPSLEIGSHFSTLVKNIGNYYSVEGLLSKHTIYPYYSPFISRERQENFFERVHGSGLYESLGMTAASFLKKEGIYYCSACAISDKENYGEPYIHREHQLQGIDYCVHHGMKLKKYPIDFLY